MLMFIEKNARQESAEDLYIFASQASVEPTIDTSNKTKLDMLKNHEIFTPKSRGGFLSSAIIFSR